MISPRLMTLLALAVAACIAHAQRVTAELSADRATLGVPVTLAVTVTDAGVRTRPETPDIDGATIAFRGQNSVNINGRGRVTFNYEIIPQRDGVITIPPLSVATSAGELQSESLFLRVAEPEPSDTTRVQLIPSEREVYVGEPFVLRYRWVLPVRAVRVRSLGSVRLPDTILVLEGVDPRPTGAPARNQRFEEITGLFDVPVWVSIDQVTRAREPFAIIEARVRAMALQPGSHELGPATVLFDELVATGRRNNWETRRSESETSTIEAQPVPTEGAPDDFAGVVGRVALDAQIDRTDIGVGDPILLRLRIAGDEPINRVSPPNLQRSPAFAESFRTDPEGWTSVGESPGARLFEIVIRAANDAVEVVPGIRVPYFDPELGLYRVAETEPMPIEVRTRRRVTAADAELAPSNNTASTGANRSPIARGDPGAPATPITPALLQDRAFTLGTAITEPASIAVLAGGPLTVIAAGAFAAARRRRDPIADRRRRARRRASARLGSTLDAQAHAVKQFIADLTGREAASITSHDAHTLMDAEHTAPLIATLRAYEHAAYTQTDAPPADVAALRRAFKCIDAEFVSHVREAAP
ncbi:MAG: BatD family protein [Planctomycetota bacterium]